MNDNSLYLSLGSNIEPKLYYLKEAVRRLSGIFKLVCLSNVYKTEPLEYADQDDFYNMCAYYKTEIEDPFVLLNIVKDIEKNTGRKYNDILKGPRQIDIDILLFGDKTIACEALIIPHDKMLQRRFVLQPLTEIMPADSEYNKKYDFISSLKRTEDQFIVKIGEL